MCEILKSHCVSSCNNWNSFSLQTSSLGFVAVIFSWKKNRIEVKCETVAGLGCVMRCTHTPPSCPPPFCCVPEGWNTRTRLSSAPLIVGGMLLHCSLPAADHFSVDWRGGVQGSHLTTWLCCTSFLRVLEGWSEAKPSSFLSFSHSMYWKSGVR